MKAQVKSIVALIAIVVVSACEPDDIRTGENWRVPPGQLIHYNNLIKSYDSEIVLKWNEALVVAIENRMPAAAEVRIFSMVTLAMHDALNNVIPKYETYALDNRGAYVKSLTKANISHVANAAVSQAAHDVLVALFPAAAGNAEVLLTEHHSQIKDSNLKATGIAIGKNAAIAMLAKRQGDLPITFTAYQKGTDPGIHQANYMPFAVANPPLWPANAVYGANFGSFTPFGITSGDQFRPDPPYAINSDEYATDYNEVKKLGCINCTDRTAEQTQIGDFWRVNTHGPMNRIARVLAVQKRLNGWETARLLALTQMAQIDAGIASFEAKYYYNYWLPVTAIRAGNEDGNDLTGGDVSWTSYIAPPPTPDYPSTPAAAGGASAEIFNRFFGTDHISFVITSPNSLPGVERSYNSFSQASNENALSRIYLGSHFRNAVIEGEKQGRKIGKYVFENNLRELVGLI
ncbi:MAG: vanadium-dependent haloperoxidase [Cyclobacteriaceae bacterium]|nr:vanadium-dependent haloperoxidase [Cyclobacteriaceae bacterium]